MSVVDAARRATYAATLVAIADETRVITAGTQRDRIDDATLGAVRFATWAAVWDGAFTATGEAMKDLS